MAVTLSIKNAPDELVQQLKQRAKRHHRSLQGELLAILEEVVRVEQPLSPREIQSRVRRLGLRTPSEAAKMVRAIRDAR